MKNKKKILMPIMALVLSVILFGYQVPNIKAEESTTVDLTNLTGYTWVGNDNINIGDGEKLYIINYSIICADPTGNSTGGTELEISGKYEYFPPDDANKRIAYMEINTPNQQYFGGHVNQANGRVYESGYDVTFPASAIKTSDTSLTTIISITFTGGTDATNSELISWLEANGTLTPPAPAGYEVTFVSNDGTSVTKLENVEELPTPLPTTNKANNIFVGWFYDSGFEVQAFSGDTISSNITLYAKFIAESTTVEFTIAPNGEMIDGAMPVKFLPKTETQPSIELIASNLDSITGSLMVIDDYQSTNNYSETLDVSLTFAEYIMFTGSSSEIGLKIGLDGNGFLYHYALIGDGAYITLSFDIVLNNTTNYVDITYMLGDVVIETKKQNKDDIPNLPLTEPTKYGFIFKGWYLEPEFTTAITLETRFTTNTTVYGYFQEKTLISVKYYDGESIISQGMQYATESLIKPSNPVKPGHVFMGWYLDSEFTTKLENDATFDSDVNIYAKFIAESGGAVIPTEENNKTLYLVGAAALLLILFSAFINRKKR